MFNPTRKDIKSPSSAKDLDLSAKNDRVETHEYELRVFADMVEIVSTRKFSPKSNQDRITGNRKAITSFTRRSRNNLLRRLAKARNDERGLFVTFTFPDSVLFTVTPEGETQTKLTILQTKHCISVLRKRMQRAFPETWSLWRIELVTRKSGDFEGEVAPHFHMLHFCNLRDMQFLRRWFRQNWYEIAHDNDKYQGKWGVDVDTINNKRHAYYYAGKYLAKPSDENVTEDCNVSTRTGRHWGVFGNYNGLESYKITLKYSDFIKMKRLVRGYLNSKSIVYSRRLARVAANASIFLFGLGDLSDGQEYNDLPPPIVRAAYHMVEF